MGKLKFIVVRNTGRTLVWSVVQREDDLYLGHVKWFGPWEQYVFEPKKKFGGVYPAGLMYEIAMFILEQMRYRRDMEQSQPEGVTA